MVGNDLAVLYRVLGRRGEAIARHRATLALAREVGDVAGACVVRNELGRTLRENGEVSTAIEEHSAALTDATRIGLRLEHARGLDGIAACLCSTEPTSAGQYWLRALTLYREMGVPEQVDVERNLAELALLPASRRTASGSR